jgi:Type I restriction modification DNA specificity domain
LVKWGYSASFNERLLDEVNRSFTKIRNKEFNLKTGKFIASALKLSLNGFGYGSQLSSSKLKNLDFKIKVPTKNGKIDFEFMERFIVELEAERIADLEAYLLSSGLKDYTLTTEEQKILDDFENTKFEKFNVIDIFDVKNTKNILSRDIVENSGDIPYLCASSENNAVSSYISYDKEFLDKGNCVFIGGKTFVVTYQEKDFYSNDSHNLVLYVKNEEERSKLIQLYLATCINKSLGHKYSWGDSISNRKIQTDKVSLPTQNNQPNYVIMETFISAIQKLIIKEVVLYADKKIAATKEVAQ